MDDSLTGKTTETRRWGGKREKKKEKGERSDRE